MKIGIIALTLLFSSFFIIACSETETPTGNIIKETETKPASFDELREEKPSCTDECYSDYCNDFKFISCEIAEDGCKSEINKGFIKGKCNVECIRNSDCKSNEQCSIEFSCIEKEIVCSDECKSDYCDKFNYVACLNGKDGCKYTQNKGLVKGKCGVECVQDSDCGSNQNCESYKCKTQEKQQSVVDIVDEIMKEAEIQVEEMMNKCNAPLKCSSNCAQYSDVGQKDCPSGKVCCMTEQSEVDQLMDSIMGQNPETEGGGEASKQEALNICYKRAKECSDDILGIEYELKGACLEIYTWTSGTSELLDFAEGLC